MEGQRSPIVSILNVIAIVVFVGGVITGVAIGFDMDSFAVALGIWAGSFITGILFLYAGEILKNLQYISSRIALLSPTLSVQREEQSETQNGAAAGSTVPTQVGSSQSSAFESRLLHRDESAARMGQNAKGTPVIPVSCENTWEMCPVCGTKQLANRKRCFNCEVEFVRNEDPKQSE